MRDQRARADEPRHAIRQCRPSALADRGNVTLVEFAPLRVTADVLDRGVLAHVVLSVAGPTLEWSCDCRRGAAAGACRHVAAAGIETWQRSPRRRT